MTSNTRLRRIFTMTLALIVLLLPASAQLPYPALVGYWHNWNTADAPYIELDEVDSRYNVGNIAFGLPINGTDYEMGFTPTQVTQATFINQVQSLQNQGRKVILSLGGATAPIKLDNTTERDVFVSSVNGLISTYGFDGIDIDFEGNSLTVSGGTIANPTDAHIIHLIDAIETILMDYQQASGQKLLLTFAPETAYVQGGQSAWSGVWGAYLPVIHALRESLDLLHVQLYNSGSMYGIDGNIYFQGTADFIVAMTEATIQGFDVDRWSNQAGPFIGLPQEKIAVGLPACPNAAGGGFLDTAQVADAIRYLRGLGPKPGSYSLSNPNGYPNLGGMMTWSVNWDQVDDCNNSAGQFAENFERIFFSTLPIEWLSFTAHFDRYGQVILHWQTTSALNHGYFVVERSADGIEWDLLHQVANTENETGESTYEWIDANPLSNTSYYRLKQVDFDGSFAYSSVLSLSNPDRADSPCAVFPNPASDYISFSPGCPDESLSLQMYNALGKRVLTSEVSATERISLTEFPAGTYYIIATDSGHTRTIHRVELIK